MPFHGIRFNLMQHLSDALLHLADGSETVDRVQNALVTVIGKQRRGFVAVPFDPLADNRLVVVVAMGQFPATGRAAATIRKGIHEQIDDRSAGGARPPRRNTADQNLRIENQGDHPVKGQAELREDLVDLLGLGTGSRITVKEDARSLGLQFLKFFFTISPMCTSGTRRPWRM